MTIDHLPAIPDATKTTIYKTFGLPDVSKVGDLDDYAAGGLAEMYRDYSQRLFVATEFFNAICKPISELLAELKKRVRGSFAPGATKIPHPFLDIQLVAPPNEYVKDLPVLFELEKHLKPDEYRAAILFKGVDVKNKPLAAEAAIKAGGTPIFDAHAGVLNKLLKDYGADSEVGKIIARGLKSQPKGEPVLQIAVNESAMKAAS